MLKPGQIEMRLTIDLVYDINGTPISRLKDMLECIASEAAGHGQFTGESPAEVETWEADVSIISDADAGVDNEG